MKISEHINMSRVYIISFCLFFVSSTAHAQRSLRFDFGPGKVAPGYKQVVASTIYTNDLGYGFESGANVNCIDRYRADALRSDLCTSDKPFYFSAALREG